MRGDEEQEAPPRTAALLPGAGSGSRLGRGPKAFVQLGGATLLERAARTLRAFVDEVLVAVPASAVEEAQRLVPFARVLAGGNDRQETVHRLVGATDAEVVLVHDVARPFLPAAVVQSALAAAGEGGACSTARSVADSLLDRELNEAVDRSRLVAVQTPQAFSRELLLRAHQAARREGRTATDDAALVRALGAPVTLIEGSSWLFKITVAEDLELARALAPHWDGAQSP